MFAFAPRGKIFPGRAAAGIHFPTQLGEVFKRVRSAGLTRLRRAIDLGSDLAKIAFGHSEKSDRFCRREPPKGLSRCRGKDTQTMMRKLFREFARLRSNRAC